MTRLAAFLAAAALLSVGGCGVLPAAGTPTPVVIGGATAVAASGPVLCADRSYEEIDVCLPLELATSARAGRVARPLQVQPLASEAYRVLELQGYPVASPLGPSNPGVPSLAPGQPVIAVFDMNDFERADAYQRELVQRVRSGLQARPPAAQSLIDPAAFVAAGSPYCARAAYLDLSWGRGFRCIGQPGFDVSPPRNGAITYGAAIVSGDGRWLVVVNLPVSVPRLPAVPADFATRPQAGIQATRTYLDGLAANDITPSLAVLDGVMESLRIRN